MADRSSGKTRPLAGHNAGEPKAVSSARTDVLPPNGPGWRRDAPTTSAQNPLSQTATQRSRNLKTNPYDYSESFTLSGAFEIIARQTIFTEGEGEGEGEGKTPKE